MKTLDINGCYDLCKDLIIKAWQEGCLIRWGHQDLYWSPSEFVETQREGKFLWGPESFQLVPVEKYVRIKKEEFQEVYCEYIKALDYSLELNEKTDVSHEEYTAALKKLVEINKANKSQ